MIRLTLKLMRNPLSARGYLMKTRARRQQMRLAMVTMGHL